MFSSFWFLWSILWCMAFIWSKIWLNSLFLYGSLSHMIRFECFIMHRLNPVYSCRLHRADGSMGTAVWDHFWTNLSRFFFLGSWEFLLNFFLLEWNVDFCLWMLSSWNRITVLFLGCWNHFPGNFSVKNSLPMKMWVSISTKIAMTVTIVVIKVALIRVSYNAV